MCSTSLCYKNHTLGYVIIKFLIKTVKNAFFRFFFENFYEFL